MPEDTIMEKASLILGCIHNDGAEFVLPDNYSFFFQQTAPAGERDRYTDMFTVNSLRMIINGQVPADPYESPFSP